MRLIRPLSDLLWHQIRVRFVFLILTKLNRGGLASLYIYCYLSALTWVPRLMNVFFLTLDFNSGKIK